MQRQVLHITFSLEKIPCKEAMEIYNLNIPYGAKFSWSKFFVNFANSTAFAQIKIVKFLPLIQFDSRYNSIRKNKTSKKSFSQFAKILARENFAPYGMYIILL